MYPCLIHRCLLRDIHLTSKLETVQDVMLSSAKCLTLQGVPHVQYGLYGNDHQSRTYLGSGERIPSFWAGRQRQTLAIVYTISHEDEFIPLDVGSIALDGIVSVTTIKTNAPWVLLGLSKEPLSVAPTTRITATFLMVPAFDISIVDTKLSVEPNMASPRVLTSGSDHISDIAPGVEWDFNSGVAPARPHLTTIVLSFFYRFHCFTFSYVMNARIPVVVAAGNNNTSASGTSLAHDAVAPPLGLLLSLMAVHPFGKEQPTCFRSLLKLPTIYHELLDRRNHRLPPHVCVLVVYFTGLNGNQSPMTRNGSRVGRHFAVVRFHQSERKPYVWLQILDHEEDGNRIGQKLQATKNITITGLWHFICRFMPDIQPSANKFKVVRLADIWA
ncbi:hypothetical protein ARMGADRAFT_1034103 [Armillaria gallica]|uniref:Peptidase S8/S53 domain-containing protein n=1 Tax=Armillaria gallica TaxID=47427 RepID=A0A2H3DIS0_ARMGA|nr:hypothetical protein ARMGADRAFT_1034103 [Armillaria gallica]